jgi:hypothetical protein
LPLPDHTIALVVKENRLYRQVVVRRSFHFTNVHPQTAVTIDVDDETIRPRKLRADRCRQTEAHGTH